MQQRKCVLCLNPKLKNQIKRDRIKRFTRKSVLKMLAVMEASQNAPGSSNSSGQAPAVTPEANNGEKEFLSSGRTGRRNALPDILDPSFSFSYVARGKAREEDLLDENDTEIEKLKKKKRENIVDSARDSENIVDSARDSEKDESDLEDIEKREEFVELKKSDEGTTNLDSKRDSQSREEIKECNENTEKQNRSQHAVVSSGDLSTKLEGLTTSDKCSIDKRDQPGCSKS